MYASPIDWELSVVWRVAIVFYSKNSVIAQNNSDFQSHCTFVSVMNFRPRLHVSGSSGYPAPDRPFVYTYPGQMYAIRSTTVRYPERFENDFKGGQPGCLDPFSSSVNGVPGHPDKFWIQFLWQKRIHVDCLVAELAHYLELFD